MVYIHNDLTKGISMDNGQLGYLLDAIAWLEKYRQNSDKIFSNNKTKKRKYTLDQGFSASHIGVATDDQDILIVVNDKAESLAKWFLNIPWQYVKVLVNPNAPKIIMVTKPVDLKNTVIKQDKILPDFAIEIALHIEIAKILNSMKYIQLGTFQYHDKKMQIVEKNKIDLPII